MSPAAGLCQRHRHEDIIQSRTKQASLWDPAHELNVVVINPVLDFGGIHIRRIGDKISQRHAVHADGQFSVRSIRLLLQERSPDLER
jgi:hypothetical protein